MSWIQFEVLAGNAEQKNSEKVDFPRAHLINVHGSITIGRDKNCDLKVMSPSVSREHALLMAPGMWGKWKVRNLSGSTPTCIVRRGQTIAVADNVEALERNDVLMLGPVGAGITLKLL